ncbi:MAG: DUF1508 domain-containing protein [Cytophagaceae bacterium]|nr:MAG: DUF1508 domain-containing protein [Cytophagaceae bacterium]
MADLSYPYFFLYKDKAEQWRWNLRAKNHKTIADSAEGYHNRQDAIHAIELVKGAVKVYDSTTKKWE